MQHYSSVSLGKNQTKKAGISLSDLFQRLPFHHVLISMAHQIASLGQIVSCVLDEGVSSQYSFRFYHVDIELGVKMPKLVLGEEEKTDVDSLSDDYCFAMAVVVVTERMFEGVTCFTRTGRTSERNNKVFILISNLTMDLKNKDGKLAYISDETALLTRKF